MQGVRGGTVPVAFLACLLPRKAGGSVLTELTPEAERSGQEETFLFKSRSPTRFLSALTTTHFPEFRGGPAGEHKALALNLGTFALED